MTRKLRFLGLDVHAETITGAVAEVDGSVRELGTIPNRPEAVRKLIAKVGGARGLRVCYEAGPTGYASSAKSNAIVHDCKKGEPFDARTRRSAGRRCGQHNRYVKIERSNTSSFEPFAPVLPIAAGTVAGGVLGWVVHRIRR